VAIDLNADLGEGFGAWTLTDDAALLDIVTSANIACGFHAGDPTTMRRVCALAARRGVAIGAQVSYRDLAGFGRRFVDASAEDLAADVLYQIGALQAAAHGAGSSVRYVKPHGALYHATIDHAHHAQAVVEAAAVFSLPVLGFPGSLLLEYAEAAGLPAIREGFADRGYTDNGRLVPRGEPGAVLVEEATIVAHALELAPEVQSVCVHGDTPGAVALARAVRAGLSTADYELAPFTSASPR
jgi:UPF0271 protein